jgi:putative NADH-flavin reductase
VIGSKGRWQASRPGNVLVAVVVVLLAACATVPADAPAVYTPPAREGEGLTLALLGATGMVGSHVLEEALARGYALRVLARSPDKLSRYADQIEIVAGDARDPVALGQLLDGADVVISAIGPVRADGAAARSLSTTVAGQMVRLMPEAGVSRYIVVSGGAVEAPGDQRDLLGWTVRTLARIAYQPTVLDKQGEYAVLAESALDWTLVRCPVIDEEPYRYPALLRLDTPPAFRVRVGELSAFLLDQARSTEYLQRAPFIGSR